VRGNRRRRRVKGRQGEGKKGKDREEGRQFFFGKIGDLRIERLVTHFQQPFPHIYTTHNQTQTQTQHKHKHKHTNTNTQTQTQTQTQIQTHKHKHKHKHKQITKTKTQKHKTQKTKTKHEEKEKKIGKKHLNLYDMETDSLLMSVFNALSRSLLPWPLV